jgi:hemerythrin-like domain-containing protein
MRIVDELQREHRLIERVAGALVTFAEHARSAGRDPEALAAFCTFFDEYADAHHHGKEEAILFRALLDVELPEKGPIAALRQEHADNRVAVAELRGTVDPAELADRSARFCAHLWEHIDKEDSVLFPEVLVRLELEKGRVERELAQLDQGDERQAALAALVALGESLASRFPPRTELPGFERGEGCSACRHFGDTCEGVEREWWSEAEWESFRSRDF